MIEALYRAYAATALSAAVRDSRWIFAAFEVLHLVGLTVAGGAILIAAGRLAGYPIGTLDRASVWRSLRWVILAGLVVQIGSGVVLVGVNPLKYFFNPSFNVKLWLLLAAIVMGIATDRLVRREHVPLGLWRVLAVLLAGLPLSVAIAGRAIGLL